MVNVLHKNLSGADAVHPAAFVQNTDPGTVGANLFWVDTSTSPPTLKVRNTGNTAWNVFAVGATGATGATGAAGVPGPAGASSTGGIAPYVNIQDQKPSATNGGTFTSGAWRTRDLTAIQIDTGGLSKLASNQITLIAGTYRTLIHAPANQCNRHAARLQNITDAATILSGSAQYGSTVSSTVSIISGRFILLSPKVLEVQHQCQTTEATDGFGIAAGAGGFSVATEIYTIAEFWQEGPPPPFLGSTQLTANPSTGTFGTRRQDQQQHSLNTPPQ